VGSDVELIGGAERRTIDIVRYDASWPDAFARERIRIMHALGTRARRIDHVGSTAVVGLAAKPIIDIDVSVEDPDAEDMYVAALEHAGYQLRVREPGHRMLRTSTRDVHVHVCASGSDWERRHLLFRDWLRRDVADRERYADTKRQLAEHDWADTNAYAAAKTAIIEQITIRAEQWAAATSWPLPCVERPAARDGDHEGK
jgi:GrpB-like predicted nucleotidyltransferase (UPF0157 family)